MSFGVYTFIYQLDKTTGIVIRKVSINPVPCQAKNCSSPSVSLDFGLFYYRVTEAELTKVSKM